MTALANLFYRIGRAVDGPTGRLAAGGDSLEFGDKRKYESNYAERDSASISFHTRPETTVSGDFKPGDYTYAALQVGNAPHVTVFLNRRSALRLIRVLEEIDGAFRKYGEGTR